MLSKQNIEELTQSQNKSPSLSNSLLSSNTPLDNNNPAVERVNSVARPPQPNSITSSLYANETLGEEDSGGDDSLAYLYNDALLSTPPSPPAVPTFQLEFGTNRLENTEAIMWWIIKNKHFLIASFNQSLDLWIEMKLKTDKSFAPNHQALYLFAKHFETSMDYEKSRDVRKEGADTFPSVSACFIDAVNGITDSDVRNSDILSNENYSLLRIFLDENPVVADCLACGLPSLNVVAELWAAEHHDQFSHKQPDCLSPLKPHIKQRALAKSPKKPFERRLFTEEDRKREVEKANWRFQQNKLMCELPPLEHIGNANEQNISNNNPAQVATAGLTVPPLIRISSTELHHDQKEEGKKSTGELLAGSMDSFLSLGANRRSPRKRNDITLIEKSSPSKISADIKLNLQDVDDDPRPSILRRGPYKKPRQILG